MLSSVVCQFNLPISISNEYFYSLMNSDGLVSKNGLGVLFAYDNISSGPVEMDRRFLEHGDKYSCIFDHLCKIVGFKYAFDTFTSPKPIRKVGSFIFTFGKIWCPSKKADSLMSPSVELKKIKSKSNYSPAYVLLVCGPIKPIIEGAACPISIVGKFLKRVCIKDFHTVVIQCHNSETFYTYAAYAENSTIAPMTIAYMTGICENDPHFYQSCGIGLADIKLYL